MLWGGGGGFGICFILDRTPLGEVVAGFLNMKPSIKITAKKCCKAVIELIDISNTIHSYSNKCTVGIFFAGLLNRSFDYLGVANYYTYLQCCGFAGHMVSSFVFPKFLQFHVK